MEPRFGHDFSRVRVHSDSRAADSVGEVRALAYTVGRDIVMGHHQYSPNTRAGQRLLAHELAHTVQQDTFSEHQSELRLGPVDDILEREADATADAVLHQAPPPDRPQRRSPRRGAHRRQRARLQGLRGDGGRSRAYQATRQGSATQETRETARRQGLRLPALPSGPASSRHQEPHREEGGRTQARGWAGTGGWWSARWRGWHGTAGSRCATRGGRTSTRRSCTSDTRSSA
jgi:hypothetical protein